MTPPHAADAAATARNRAEPQPQPGAFTRANATRPTAAAISAGTPRDRPHSAEPTLKTIKPATKIRRRPTRSAHRPAGTSTAANTIVYAFSTHDSEPRLVPWYSRPM